MQNPFESGHIKNYLLLYASVVVIVILFFIAATLFYDVKEQEKKVFPTQKSAALLAKEAKQTKVHIKNKKVPKEFKLLEKGY
jgi:predicted RNA-binding protein with PUA domain